MLITVKLFPTKSMLQDLDWCTPFAFLGVMQEYTVIIKVGAAQDMPCYLRLVTGSDFYHTAALNLIEPIFLDK